MTFVHHQAFQLRASLDQYAPCRCTEASTDEYFSLYFKGFQKSSSGFRAQGLSWKVNWSGLWGLLCHSTTPVLQVLCEPLCPPEGVCFLQEAQHVATCSRSKLSYPSKDKSGAKCQLNPTDPLFSGFLDPLVLVILAILLCLHGNDFCVSSKFF